LNFTCIAYSHFSIRMDDTHMSHLAERLGVFLSVQMYINPFYGQNFFYSFVFGKSFVSFFSQQVNHHSIGTSTGISQRKIKNSTQMLTKLRSEISFYRLMSRIVWSWSQLVNQNFAFFGQEHLYSQQPYNL